VGLAVFTLRFAGFEIAGTSVGEEFLNLAINNHPDLILLDAKITMTNGSEAIKTLRAKPETKSFPVIFILEPGQENEVQKYLDKGGTDCIIKPIDPDQLTKAVFSSLKRTKK